jgi:hypothetical protein
MLPVSLDYRFDFLNLESGNIGGTQDEEKQNGNPEKLAT